MAEKNHGWKEDPTVWMYFGCDECVCKLRALLQIWKRMDVKSVTVPMETSCAIAVLIAKFKSLIKSVSVVESDEARWWISSLRCSAILDSFHLENSWTFFVFVKLTLMNCSCSGRISENVPLSIAGTYQKEKLQTEILLWDITWENAR